MTTYNTFHTNMGKMHQIALTDWLSPVSLRTNTISLILLSPLLVASNIHATRVRSMSSPLNEDS